MLTAEEAQALTDEIRTCAERLCTLLLRAKEGEAWKALGYKSWRAYATAEFELPQSRAYELLNHGRVIEELEASDSAIAEMPNEGQSRELIKVPAGQRAEAWQATLEATDGKPTAAAVKEATEAYFARNGRPERKGPSDEGRAKNALANIESSKSWATHVMRDVREGITPAAKDQLRSEIAELRELLSQIEGEL